MGLGPILVFAPRRRAAEEIAQQLAHELPEVDPLELTGEQKKILGKELIGIHSVFSLTCDYIGFLKA